MEIHYMTVPERLGIQRGGTRQLSLLLSFKFVRV